MNRFKVVLLAAWMGREAALVCNSTNIHCVISERTLEVHGGAELSVTKMFLFSVLIMNIFKFMLMLNLAGPSHVEPACGSGFLSQTGEDSLSSVD